MTGEGAGVMEGRGGGGGVGGGYDGRVGATLVLVTARYPAASAGMTEGGCGYDGEGARDDGGAGFVAGGGWG